MFASFPPPPPSSAVNSENHSSSFSRCSELAKHNATSLRNQQGREMGSVDYHYSLPHERNAINTGFSFGGKSAGNASPKNKEVKRRSLRRKQREKGKRRVGHL
jgi:hypothetical protein